MTSGKNLKMWGRKWVVTVSNRTIISNGHIIFEDKNSILKEQNEKSSTTILKENFAF
jgi:hypothetical protein